MRHDSPALSDCIFYHSFDLPNGGHIKGDWDLRGRFDEYVGGTSLKGRTFLDVGTASGFLSFEAEKRGAIVTSFDSDSADNWETGPGETVDYAYYDGMRNSYRYAHAAFNSRVVAKYGNIYSLSKTVGMHEVVLLGQILVHLRDPLAAIEQAARCANERLIIAEGMFDTDEPQAVFLGGSARYAWWHLSRGTYAQWLKRLGFEVTAVTKADYLCPVLGISSEIWTIVADRVGPTLDRIGRLPAY
jgi:hypothetical protein